MTDEARRAEARTQRQAMRLELTRLVAAIDRRVPRLEHLGEAKIASDAAQLRDKAIRLLAELDAEEK